MSRIDQPPGAPRRTQETDTRQALQRHDPEFYRRRKDEGHPDEPSDPYEDLTDVSIPALRNFLTGLLDRAEAAGGGAAPAAPGMTQAVAAPRAPSTPQAAAAMQAYKTGASRGGPSMPASPPPVPSAAAADRPQSALDQAALGLDRAAVLDLVRALDRLTAAGVATISLEKSDNFLGSIRAAIDAAMDRLRPFEGGGSFMRRTNILGGAPRLGYDSMQGPFFLLSSEAPPLLFLPLQAPPAIPARPARRGPLPAHPALARVVFSYAVPPAGTAFAFLSFL